MKNRYLIISAIALIGVFVYFAFQYNNKPYAYDETKVIAPPGIADTIVYTPGYKLVKKVLPKRDASKVNRQYDPIFSYDFSFPSDHKTRSKEAKSAFVNTSAQQLTSPPIYGQKCLTAIKPEDCSQRYIDTYFQQSLLNQGYTETLQDTLMASFVVDEYGAVNGPITVKGETSCLECKSIILKAISGMTDWSSATLSSKAARVKVVLPIVI